MTAQAFETADEMLAQTLAAGETIARAAKTADVSESTVYRRLREPIFQARVFELRAGLIETARNRIANRTLAACDTLDHLLVSRSEAIQLRAAKTFIELAVKLHNRDLHAGPSDENELSQVKSESLPPPVSAPQATDPQEPGPVRSEPTELPRPVTPRPEIAAEQAKGSVGSDTGRESVASPANDDTPASSARVARKAALPSLLAAGEGGGLNKSARDLSNPVKTCHRPAGHPPVNEVDRLSTGLTVALAGVGGE